MSEQSKAGGNQPPAISDLLASRTDYEDVPVPALGGKELRVWGLSGTARAHLLSQYNEWLPDGEDEKPQSSEQLRHVLMFQVDVVAASLGYPPEEWEAVGMALGATAVEQLFDTAAALSGIGPAAQAEAVQRLRPTAKEGSGTD